ncbi:MAG: hypothetical protein RBU37_02230 [Myxococcota bacterium]|jgi:hypothetical protein|nr:hypothetical protein [Myxococcota bacterium]
MNSKPIITAIAFSLLLAGLSACSSSAEILPTRAMPPGASFEGLWYSNYGDMRLQQEGNKVTGTFDYKLGGSIEGELQGGVLVFDWRQEGDLNLGRRDVFGKGYFVISDNGISFEGKWGYAESYSNGGTWTANKATEIYKK